MGRADIVGTGRHQAVVDAMMAKVALSGHALIVVEFNGVIRAGLNAIPASYADVPVDDDDAVFTLVGGPYRACGHA